MAAAVGFGKSLPLHQSAGLPVNSTTGPAIPAGVPPPCG
jgi:hypothetical protein